MAIDFFAASSPLTRPVRPTARSYRASAAALSAKLVSPEYETIRAQSPLEGPEDASRVASFWSVVRSAGLWPAAPRARRMPSIVAQSRPAAFALAFRFEANFGDSRSAGGVGSGSGELSQIVAALAGPSISGAGAGFCFGSRIVRSFVFFQPLAAFADAFADGLAAACTCGSRCRVSCRGRGGVRRRRGVCRQLVDAFVGRNSSIGCRRGVGARIGRNGAGIGGCSHR